LQLNTNQSKAKVLPKSRGPQSNTDRHSVSP